MRPQQSNPQKMNEKQKKITFETKQIHVNLFLFIILRGNYGKICDFEKGNPFLSLTQQETEKNVFQSIFHDSNKQAF